jgi:hypothetical protein
LDDPQGPAAAAAINNNPSACIACKAPFVKVDSDPYFGEGTGCVLRTLNDVLLYTSTLLYFAALVWDTTLRRMERLTETVRRRMQALRGARADVQHAQ